MSCATKNIDETDDAKVADEVGVGEIYQGRGRRWSIDVRSHIVFDGVDTKIMSHPAMRRTVRSILRANLFMRGMKM